MTTEEKYNQAVALIKKIADGEIGKDNCEFCSPNRELHITKGLCQDFIARTEEK